MSTLMKNQIELTEQQLQEIIKIAKEAYRRPQDCNTDIYLIDGEVTRLDHHGNTGIRDGELLLAISSQDTREYQDMFREDLSETQIDFCERNSYLTIKETDSENESDWEEFTINDDGDFESNIIDQLK